MSDIAHPELRVRLPNGQVATTVTAIVQAFTELARVQPVNRIAVTDLVERAGVGRSTFYDHFGSVEDLLLWLVDALVDWSRDDHGQMQLDALLTFVADMSEVTAGFLQFGSCAMRCEDAIAEALQGGEIAAQRFAAAGTMGALRSWLVQDDPPNTQEFVTQTCDLVETTLAGPARKGSASM